MLQGKITKIHQGDQFCFAPLRGSTRVSGIRAQVNCSRQNPELLKTRRETEMLRRMMLRLTVCLTGVGCWVARRYWPLKALLPKS
jgi:hypothetical protein